MRDRRPALASIAALSALVLSVIGLAGPEAAAQGTVVPLSDCSGFLGTFLTTESGKGEGREVSSRSLLSLSSDGQAILIDANQSGVAGTAPYGPAAGAWQCILNDDGTTSVSALLLHFNYATTESPKQQIGRLEIEASADGNQERISGVFRFSLFPIDADPLQQSDQEPALSGPFEGQKIVMSAPS